MFKRLVMSTTILFVACLPSGEEKMNASITPLQDIHIVNTITLLKEKYGEQYHKQINNGVKQVGSLWRHEDGNAKQFSEFCLNNFITNEQQKLETLKRFDRNLELIFGYETALTRGLREWTELDLGKSLPIDALFAAYNPFDHAIEDAFRTKIAFVALLNYPLMTLEELVKKQDTLTRQQWAQARLTKLYSSRVPGNVSAELTKAYAEASEYIDNYNIYMHHVITDDGSRLFPEGKKLITHWGLRDEIKSLYVEPQKNLNKQRMIRKVMNRIITQEIPSVVIDNPQVDWNPSTNQIIMAGNSDQTITEQPEPNTRYKKLLAVFHAMQKIDKYSPNAPTHIDRQFNMQREISEQEIETLLTDIVSNPVVKDIAAIVKKRLGRSLEPHDIWYDGFKTRQSLNEDHLSIKTKALYKRAEDFQKNIPVILQKLGFTETKAKKIAEFIAVDPARGAGHALEARMRTDKTHLRTRISENGMDYKGYNIAIHELGHNVEQVFSLQGVDYTLLQGVPNNAFTEAFAFLFQARDLDLLDVKNPMSKEKKEALKALDTFWNTFEIAGVALVDMQVWRYMYDHPQLDEQELKTATIEAAKNVWNKYYAEIFGEKDVPLLAIYSHMIAYGLYLPDYPIGFLIQFQIEEYIKDKNLATEMERMCTFGNVTPHFWMTHAVGKPVSSKPLIQAASKAVTVITED